MSAAAQLGDPQPRDSQGRFIARPRLQTLRRYWRDPAFRAALDAERDAKRAQINAQFDANIAAARRARGWEG